MKNQEKENIYSTGEIALGLSSYRLLFHIIMLLAAGMTTIAAIATIFSGRNDSIAIVIYFALSIVFSFCLFVSIIANSPRVTHITGCVAAICGASFTALHIINDLFGENASQLAEGIYPFSIGWLPIALVAAFIYLPSKVAIRFTLFVNSVVAIFALIYASQHWPGNNNSIVFFVGQILLVNNLGIALLMLHSLTQNRTAAILDEVAQKKARYQEIALVECLTDPGTGLKNQIGTFNSIQKTMDLANSENLATHILAFQFETGNPDGPSDDLIKEIISIVSAYTPENAQIGHYEPSIFMLWLSADKSFDLGSLAKQIDASFALHFTSSMKISWHIGGLSTSSLREAPYLVDQCLYELQNSVLQTSEHNICIADFSNSSA